MKKTPGSAYWDSSALVLLVCQQPLSAKARSAHRIHSLLHVWWGTRIECHSALRRLIREGFLTSKEEQQAFSSLGKLANQWVEILPAEDIRQQAERLLSLHALRAADALQLAAALRGAKGFPKGGNSSARISCSQTPPPKKVSPLHF
jgi:hypothetical protein